MAVDDVRLPLSIFPPAPSANIQAMLTEIAQAHKNVNNWGDLAQAAQQAQNSIAQQNAHYAQAQPSNFHLHARARGLLLDRLGGIEGPCRINPNDFLMCHVFDGIVYIFFIFDKKEGMTKESTDLFPSDKLVAQMRMVMMA
jgi:hypothetical protein